MQVRNAGSSERHRLHKYRKIQGENCCTKRQGTLTAAQCGKRHWLLHNTVTGTNCCMPIKTHFLQHNTARGNVCCTIRQGTLTAAQYGNTDCCTTQQEALRSTARIWLLHDRVILTAAQYSNAPQYSKRHCTTTPLTAARYSNRNQLLHNTARDIKCCAIQWGTLTIAQYSKRHCAIE